jgi:hypothetical protein
VDEVKKFFLAIAALAAAAAALNRDDIKRYIEMRRM